MTPEERKKMIRICEQLIEISEKLMVLGRETLGLITGLYEILADDQRKEE